jgi:hypothetical protein
MVTLYGRRWCERDRKFVLAKQVQPWHYVHGLISLATFGLWLPVWLVLTLISDKRYFCPECGGPTHFNPGSAARKQSAAPSDAEAE